MPSSAADPLERLARQYLTTKAAGLTASRSLTRVDRWRGTGVSFCQRSDGSVSATCLGVSGYGPSEEDALRDLEHRLRIAEPGTSLRVG